MQAHPLSSTAARYIFSCIPSSSRSASALSAFTSSRTYKGERSC